MKIPESNPHALKTPRIDNRIFLEPQTFATHWGRIDDALGDALGTHWGPIGNALFWGRYGDALGKHWGRIEDALGTL